jgi:putative ATP-dependent endonuclease of the OLD family
VVPLSDVSLKCLNFKCFGEPMQGFDQIKPMNIIIGRNNSGKTTLLDLLEYAVNFTDISQRGHNGKKPEAFVSWELLSDFLQTHIQGEVPISRQQHHLGPFAMNSLRGNRLVSLITGQESVSLKDVAGYSPENDISGKLLDVCKTILQKVVKNPFNEFTVRRIVADRDIRAEGSNKDDSPDRITIESNGQKFTRIVERFLNAHGPQFPRNLIEETLLTDLNRLLRPDADYRRIVVEQHESGPWEIQLEERGKGFIPLSQTGSGLKTILLVLANIILIPGFGGQPPLSQFLFGFEELENNLHPAIQRRLFRYLSETAKNTGCRFFITTHSHVVIDQFSGDDDAQLLHVEHNGESATVNTVNGFSQSQRILDDLDVRASDLLQTNVVIWVEGPSDRIYLNKWIEIWSNDQLVEGIHYQCLAYGGSQNAHFSFEEPDTLESEGATNDLIGALKINRHAIVIADSDRSEEEDELKVHTRRLAEEANANGGYAWVTDGKEVENYIPVDALQSHCENDSLTGPDKYADVLAYVGQEKNTARPKKVALARKVIELLDREMISETLDLAQQLDVVCQRIREWNRLDSGGE